MGSLSDHVRQRMNPDERIAFYLSSLSGGGAQRVMLTLANAMAEHGVQIDLVLVKARGPFLAQVHPGVRVIDLGVGNVTLSLPGLVRYLRRERPAALLSSLKHVNLVALIARRLSRVPLRLVVGEHNTLSHSCKSGLKDRMLPHLMRVLYPKADLVVAVSQGVADDLCASLELAKEKVQVIFNPVVRSEIAEQAAAPLDHPWFRPGEPPVILGMGRLTEQKDFPNLIHAFAFVRKERNCRLMILGEGELHEELQGLVTRLGLSASVSLPGFVDTPFAYMGRAAVFVLSSRWEGLPTVLIEAMACGSPVVSTDCPSGPAEILERGEWGRLVPVGDSAALAAAISATLDDGRPPIVMERAAMFRVEKARDRYLEVLLESELSTPLDRTGTRRDSNHKKSRSPRPCGRI